MKVTHASQATTSLSISTMYIQTYANTEKKAVILNTPNCLMTRTSPPPIAMTQIADITRRLNAALPTMQDGPRPSTAGLLMVPTVSITAKRISGAEDPRAISVKLEIVAFHTCTC